MLKAVLNGSLTVIAVGYLVNEDDSTATAMSGMVARFLILYRLFFFIPKMRIELLA